MWAALEPITAADLWWTLATGRWIVDHGTIPDVDVFSYTFRGSPVSSPEWLAQVSFYVLHRWLGPDGLAVLKILAVVGTFALAAWVAARHAGAWTVAILVACAAAYLCRPFLDLRPQIVTFPAALAILGLLYELRRTGSVRVLLLIPVVVAVWVNLHGGFIFGIAICALFAATEGVVAIGGFQTQAVPRQRVLLFVTAAVLAGAAALANPQGVPALVFPFTILGGDSGWREVVEWIPPPFFEEAPYSPLAFWYFLAAQLVIFVAAAAIAPSRIDVADATLFVGTGAMALTSRRFIPLFALMTVPFLARNLVIISSGVDARGRRSITAVLAGVALCSATLVTWRLAEDVRRIGATGLFADMTRSSYFPEGGVEFLEANPLPARLYNFYSWGGYLMFQAPDRPVFIDPRAHLLYPDEFWRENRDVEMSSPRWETVLDKYAVSLVLWPALPHAHGRWKALLEQLAAAPAWTQVYDDGESTLFAHDERGRPWVEAYQSLTLKYPDRAGAQLFAGETMLRLGAFEMAHAHFEGALTRHPSLQTVLRDTLLVRIDERARATGDPGAWFQVGFLNDILGDGEKALAGYRKAAELGIRDPMATFLRSALVRLQSKGSPS